MKHTGRIQTISLSSYLFVLFSTIIQLHSVNGNLPPRLVNYDQIRTLFKFENTTIGTVLGTITATDPDGPHEIVFDITDDATKALVRLSEADGDSKTGRSVNIILIKELDRDREPLSRKLYFTVADAPSYIQERNVIPVTISLYIKDVNDEAPEFTTLRYKESVYENAQIGTTVIVITAKDPDNGLGGSVVYSMKASDDRYEGVFRIDSNTGAVIINGTLDYEEHNFYEFIIKAQDRLGLVSNTTADFVVTVLDIQDTPPSFFNLPYTESINEDATIGDSVLQITALDGDRGVPNTLEYSFVNDTQGNYENFDINPRTGHITVRKHLDRDDPAVQEKGGVYDFRVQAKEIVPNNQTNYGNTTAVTLVTISVRDVNDNPPEFNQDHFEARVLENMQSGVPVTFTGTNNIMHVKDIDQGENSHFELFLQQNGQPYYDFAPLPSQVYSESSINIRVNNSINLDYEKYRSVTFEIVAREITTKEQRSTTATVTVNIEDMNDNQPVFNQTSYHAEVPENSPPDTPVITIQATDFDSNAFGKVTYSLRGGNGRFQINNTTGLVTVSGPLDREKVEDYYLSVEAKDGGGFRSTVELSVVVKDENDNAPVFRRDEYYGSVVENSHMFLRGPVMVQADDDDKPGTNNSRIMYKITYAPPGLENNFTVHGETGELSLTDSLDYEKLNKSLKGTIVLILTAYDFGDPSHSSNINVTIEVEDKNDNAPIFKQNKYTGLVYENATAGTFILAVNASDGDGTELNSGFLYRIDSGAQDKFRIDFNTGAITVEIRAKLDRETTDTYVLNVSANDRGQNPLVGYTEVHINVLDVNDRIPEFPQQEKTVHVSEGHGVGRRVAFYNATDEDLNSVLEYSIIEDATIALDENGNTVNVTSNNINEYFTIESETSEIKIKNHIDRETAEKVILQILVTDTQAWLPAIQTATATLTIIIDDINDNRPVFQPNNSYHVDVSEGRQLNDPILTVVATDADKGQTLLYVINHPTQGDAAYFDIPLSNSGLIKLKKKLDREEKESMTFEVIVTDDMASGFSSTATVSVKVLDINDNAPQFIYSSKVFNVSEDASKNTNVTQMVAEDKDAGAFAKVFYTIEGTDGKFHIDRYSGLITVNGTLDHETKNSYSIKVTATDNENDTVNPQLSTISETLIINILDVNDNDPEITNIDNFPVSIREGTKPGEIIKRFSASDPDFGANGTVEFSLTSEFNTTDNTPWFEIQNIPPKQGGKTEGQLKLLADLKGKVGIFYITIILSDKGSPPRNSTKNFFIEVVDENLNDPVFHNPDTATIMEEIHPALVTIINATDADHGSNGHVIYYMQPVKDYQSFKLDNITGRLEVITRLDKEDPIKRGIYEVSIIAKDQGNPSRSSAMTLTIQLLDSNDKDPVFEREGKEPFIMGPIPEDTSPVYVGSVDVATDADSAVENKIICYHIVGGDTLRNRFTLNAHGNLTLDQSIDRDVGPTNYVNLVVWATPFCQLSFDKIEPVEYDPANTTLMWVQVKIQDINDHPPKFKRSLLNIGVTRKTQFGEIIYQLHNDVLDADDGKNRQHVYKRNEISYHPYQGTPQISQSDVDSTFYLFVNNGTLKTNTYFSSDWSGYYLVNITVQDKEPPMKTDSTIIKISLINDDQRVKVIFRRSIENVKNFSETFRQDLEALIPGYIVVVDKIQTHENAEGKPEVDKTDMFIHAEENATNNILEASELLRLIDTYAFELLNKYDILNIVLTTTQEEEESQRLLLMGIILLAIVLGIPCIVLGVVLYMSRKKYKRKLKAATAMAYGSKDSDMQKLDMPTTNLHAYENANPIFMEKVLLEEAGEKADYDSLDNNEVDVDQIKTYDVQEKQMNFLGDTEPPYMSAAPDTNLNAAILAHEAAKNANNKKNGFKPNISNGSKRGSVEAVNPMFTIQATEI